MSEDEVLFSAQAGNERQTDEIALLTSKALPLGSTLGLTGELGAGKTTFVKYLLRHLGIKDLVQSPSYVLQNIYSYGSLLVEHWDLYRLNSLPDELLEDAAPDTLRVVEWADRIPGFLDSLDLIISISICDLENKPNSRLFEFSGKLALLCKESASD